jgi:hypothetical protein
MNVENVEKCWMQKISITTNPELTKKDTYGEEMPYVVNVIQNRIKKEKMC